MVAVSDVVTGFVEKAKVFVGKPAVIVVLDGKMTNADAPEIIRIT